MQKKIKLALSVAVLSCMTVNAHAFLPAAPDGTTNDPADMDPNYVRDAETLNRTLKARLPNSKMPASDDYWADYANGIALRWQDNVSSYGTYSKRKLKEMNGTEEGKALIKRLSPTEKFDIFLGDYSYGITKTAKLQAVDHGAERTWEGICHGWTSSVINNAEPEAVTLVNEDGIVIPFGASDVKALMAYSYTGRAKLSYNSFFGAVGNALQREDSGFRDARQIGGRCNTQDFSADRPISSSCEDVDAGAFHIVLLNQIAMKQHAFIADIDNTIQVWNQPISGYQILKIEDAPAYAGMSSGAVRVQKVQIIMEYVAEINPHFEPVVGTNKQRIEGKAYEYYIDLDASGKIIGGKWLRHGEPETTMQADGTPKFQENFAWKTITNTQALEHPDFLWIVDPAPRLGVWKTFMEKVYKARSFLE